MIRSYVMTYIAGFRHCPILQHSNKGHWFRYLSLSIDMVLVGQSSAHPHTFTLPHKLTYVSINQLIIKLVIVSQSSNQSFNLSACRVGHQSTNQSINKSINEFLAYCDQTVTYIRYLI